RDERALVVQLAGRALSRRVAGAVPGIERGRAGARGVGAVAGRRAVRPEKEHARVVAAGRRLPRPGVVEGADAAGDVVVREPARHVEDLVAPGEVDAPTLGLRGAQLFLQVHAPAGPLEVGGVVEVDVGGDGGDFAVGVVHR